ncbi:MAG: leucine-rich repeat protein, partial [Clostridia bacterium]|nr:leucine-rich repeat protein [Clostridia bacterium]
MLKKIGVFMLLLALLVPLCAAEGEVRASKLGVKVIEAGAFSEDQALSTITLDEDLTYIGSKAFQNCTGLLTVYCFSPDVVIEDDAFEGVEDAVVYCNLDSSMDTYAHNKGLSV